MAATLGARIGVTLHHALDRASGVARDGASALCLGLLREADLDSACEVEYLSRGAYRDADYNRSGLRGWERAFVDRYLQPGTRVLIASAGGGREMLALHRLGFRVTGFECNQRLLAWGEEFLKEEKAEAALLPAAPGECPSGLPPCDAVIVGWGGYHHIRPADRRVRFLSSLRRQLSAGSPLLVSFFESTGARTLRVSRWANRIRRAIGRAPVEAGDTFGPPPLHYFTRDEVEAELQRSGFTVDFYSAEGYPHAVGIATA